MDELRKKSYELAKLERQRTSVFTDDLEVCYVCSQKGLYRPSESIHEILYGTNRKNSMLFGYVLPLCIDCHQSFHKNRVLTNTWIQKCQKYHERKYGLQDWMSRFHRNYL